MADRKRRDKSRVSGNDDVPRKRTLGGKAALFPLLLVALGLRAFTSCLGGAKPRAVHVELVEPPGRSHRNQLVDAETQRVSAAFKAKPPATLAEATAVIGVPGECTASATTPNIHAQWRFRATIPDGDDRVYADPKARDGAGEAYLGAPIKLRVRGCDGTSEVVEVVYVGGAN